MSGGGFYQNSFRSSADKNPQPVRLKMAQIDKTRQAHTEAPWTFRGRELNLVTAIGVVVEAYQQTEFCQIYLLEDDTGRMKVRRWKEDTRPEDWDLIQVQKAIQVTGHIKAFGTEKYVTADSIDLRDGDMVCQQVTDEMVEYGGLPALQQKLLQAMLAMTVDDDGVFIEDVIEKAVKDGGQDTSPNAISDGIDALMEARNINTTFDDNHF